MFHTKLITYRSPSLFRKWLGAEPSKRDRSLQQRQSAATMFCGYYFVEYDARRRRNMRGASACGLRFLAEEASARTYDAARAFDAVKYWIRHGASVWNLRRASRRLRLTRTPFL